MTMVAGCSFSDGAVVIADSRATWETPLGRRFDDSLQKVLHLGPKLAVGYAGNAVLAGLIVQALRKAISENPGLGAPGRVAAELPRIARSFYEQHKDSAHPERASVGFVLAGVEVSSVVSMWALRSPNFEAKRIQDSFDVLGSGEVVRHYLQRTFGKLRDVNGLKQRADWLIQGLESDLAKHAQHTEDTVGGLFQVVLVGQDGIQPMRYGFLDVDPQGLGYARSIRMESGRWIQTDLTGKKEVLLLEPLELAGRSIKEQRIHDIRLPDSKGKMCPAHLQYFTTCIEAKRDVGSTEFRGMTTSFTTFGYPKDVPILTALSFWGPRGDHEVLLRLDFGEEIREIHQGKVRIEYPTEPVECDTRAVVQVKRPGLAFLDLVVDGELLGRRALHFIAAPIPVPKTREESIAALRQFVAQDSTDHTTCKDPLLNGKGPFLSYFVLCQEYHDDDTCSQFIGEMKAVFWKDYPLSLRLFLAACLRMSPGNHNMCVELVNVATREASTVATASVVATAECREVPVQGEIIAKIPTEGFYFFNLKIDGRLVSSTPIPMEIGKRPFSYTLTDDMAKRVSSGELLILLKRSKPVE